MRTASVILPPIGKTTTIMTTSHPKRKKNLPGGLVQATSVMAVVSPAAIARVLAVKVIIVVRSVIVLGSAHVRSAMERAK
jgi:hypothetical protein